jgi:cell division protein FtsB
MNAQRQYVATTSGVKKTLVCALLVMCSAYFLVHSVVGKNGLISYVRVKKQIEEKNATLTNKQAEVNRIQRLTKLLSNDSLDMDLLEERCRAVLGYASPNDIVIKAKTIIDN